MSKKNVNYSKPYPYHVCLLRRGVLEQIFMTIDSIFVSLLTFPRIPKNKVAAMLINKEA
jgi:hypothetical protein